MCNEKEMLGSKKFYSKILEIKSSISDKFEVILPNCVYEPESEQNAKDQGTHLQFKQQMFKQSLEKIKESDMVLVVNLINYPMRGYIGGATFLEMYEAYSNNKPIYLLNKPEKNLLYDEISGMDPIIINGNLEILD